MIPFLDLGAAYRELKTEIDAAVSRVLASGWYIGGAEVTAFEEEWAEYCQAGHAIGTGNGLDALILALKACDIGPGDGVIVPSNTYIATWLAVSSVGGTIQPVEPDPETHNIDPARIAAAITPETRAIMPVHLYGQPVDLDPVLDLAKTHGLRVIEDAAQAHGARYKGKPVGAHGDAVCWSFYPGKNLGALGDGGAVTTDDPDIAARVRRLGNYGSGKKYYNAERGMNSRLDPVQAAVLRVKLAHLDAWNERRKEIVALYATGLRETALIRPAVPAWADPVWHLYVVRSAHRDELKNRLTDAGIGTLIHYPLPPHMQEAYSDLGIAPDELPVARQLADEVLSIPIGPHLDVASAQKVVNAIAL